MLALAFLAFAMASCVLHVAMFILDVALFLFGPLLILTMRDDMECIHIPPVVFLVILSHSNAVTQMSGSGPMHLSHRRTRLPIDVECVINRSQGEVNIVMQIIQSQYDCRAAFHNTLFEHTTTTQSAAHLTTQVRET